MNKIDKQDTRSVGFGIIGTGEITRIMRPAFTSFPDSVVVAVADVNGEAARVEAEALGGASAFIDYRELLDSPAVQAVYIATPPFLHREMVLEAMAAGKHVLCEKPFMLNQVEAREIAAAHALRSALKVASCSSRFHGAPPVCKAKEIIAGGGIGRLLRMRFVHAMPLPKPISTLPPWKQKRATAGGGVLMDWGVYDLDWMRFLLGEIFDPVAVFARTDNWLWEEGDIDSSFSAEILLSSGVSIDWERRIEHGPAFQRIEIRGTSGGLDVPFMSAGTPESLTLHCYEEGNQLHTEVMPESVTDWNSILHYPVRDFVSAILHDQETASPPASQVKIHSVIDALYASSSSQRCVEVKP